LNTFLSTTAAGQVFYQLLVYRGNHHRSCDDWTLPANMTRLVVGHTPDDSVRVSCGGKLLAIDSSLSRYFRNSGNMYCRHKIASTNGRYQCDNMQEQCQGQIVRMMQDGRIDILQA
jgi:hypothetical protein